MRAALALIIASLLALLSAAPASAQIDRRGVSASGPNPLIGEKWFVDDQEPAFASLRSYGFGFKKGKLTARRVAGDQYRNRRSGGGF